MDTAAAAEIALPTAPPAATADNGRRRTGHRATRQAETAAPPPGGPDGVDGQDGATGSTWQSSPIVNVGVLRLELH